MRKQSLRLRQMVRGARDRRPISLVTLGLPAPSVEGCGSVGVMWSHEVCLLQGDGRSLRTEVLPRREAGKPDLSVSMVWISPPWPIPIHEDFTESGAEKRRALGQQAGGIPGVVLTGCPKWGLPFCRSDPT